MVVLGVAILYASLNMPTEDGTLYLEGGSRNVDVFCGYFGGRIFYTDLNTLEVFSFDGNTSFVAKGLCLAVTDRGLFLYRDGRPYLREWNGNFSETNFLWCEGDVCMDINGYLEMSGKKYDVKVRNPKAVGVYVFDSLGNIIKKDTGKIYSFRGWSFGYSDGKYVYGGSRDALAKVSVDSNSITFLAIPLNIEGGKSPVSPLVNKFKGKNFGILLNGGFVISGDRIYICPGRTVEYFDGNTVAGQTLDGNVYLFKGDFRAICTKEKNIVWTPVFVFPVVSKLEET